MKCKYGNWFSVVIALLVLLAMLTPGTHAQTQMHLSDVEDTEPRETLSITEIATTELVSISSNGTQGNNMSNWPSISADGRYVAFQSDSSNLVSGDTGGNSDIFVHDRITRLTERVSVASDGSQGNYYSESPSISADGRFVAFHSDASNLIGEDEYGPGVFVRDRQTGQTECVSVTTNGTLANRASHYPSISADGRYVAFGSEANNLVAEDNNAEDDIFVHDRILGTTIRVSVATDGTQSNFHSAGSSISSDGRYVAFGSYANNLVSGDTNYNSDVFVHDISAGQTERISVASDGTEGNDWSGIPSISGDGRYVAFQSQASNLVSGDTNNERDAFVHDRESGSTVIASIASDGTKGNDWSGPPSISSDGRFVTFSSRSHNLINSDLNGDWDVFVHDFLTDQTVLASVSSYGVQGNGYSGSPWKPPAISNDGRYIAFESYASNLVCMDTNETVDIMVHDRFGELSSISGRVNFTDYEPIAGVLISDGVSLETTTDDNGDYLLVGLVPCTYTIKPSKDFIYFSPASKIVTVSPDALDLDFVGWKPFFLPIISK